MPRAIICIDNARTDLEVKRAIAVRQENNARYRQWFLGFAFLLTKVAENKEPTLRPDSSEGFSF